MKHSLNLLMEQCDKRQENLARNLSNLQNSLNRIKATRQSLETYLGEYFQQHLQQSGKTGGHLRSHDKFVARIETALSTQSAEAEKVMSQIQQVSEALLQTRVERMRYEALLSRLANSEAQALAKREQKTTDELSGRLAAARILAARRQQGA